MTKLRFLLLIAIILQIPMLSPAQFSREQAKDLVVNQILVSDTGHINIYSSYNAVLDTGMLILVNKTTIHLPFSSNWVFLADDYPFTNWSHPCRYVFVNTSDGDYVIDTSNVFPVDLNTGYEIILHVLVPQQNVFPCAVTYPTFSTENPHLYAVLISGYEWQNFAWDIALVYNMLIEAGYSKKNITVLYALGVSSFWDGKFDGGDNSVINASATSDNIDLTFSKLATALSKEDQLFVYITGLGFWDQGEPTPTLYLEDPTSSTSEYTATHLVDAVHPIDCAQMIFVMQQNYSGGFIQPLLNDPITPFCRNRIVQTAAGLLSSPFSHLEEFISAGTVDEFTFYWTSAARGYYPTVDPWMWSCPVGTAPFTTWMPSIWTPNPWNIEHPADFAPDNTIVPYPYNITGGNSDGYTQLIEAFNYANCMDTWSDYGYYNPWYQNQVETPMYGIDNGFSHDDLFCLNGIAGNTSTGTTTQQVLGRSYLLGGNLNVLSPMSLQTSILSPSTFTFGVPNSVISVAQDEEFSVAGSNISFKGDFLSNGIYIHNSNNTSLILDYATFTQAYLNYNGQDFHITNSTFLNCGIVASHHGDVFIDQSSFTSTPFVLEEHDPLANTTATVSNCVFDQPIQGTKVLIEDYKNFSVTYNTINRAADDGLSLIQCGHGTGTHLIRNNYIHNSGQSGLNLYYSNATVTMNHLENNLFGIKLLNSGNTSLFGDDAAQDYSETQLINDNAGIEIYVSDNSLPYYMRFNAVVDEDNQGAPSDPLLYYDNRPTNLKYDITYNCWGVNFDPEEDLYSNSGYLKYSPVWCPAPGGKSDAESTMAADMYNTAEGDIQQENYSSAKNLLQLLIETYPKSDYSQAAMKELMTVEPFAGDDFSGLRTYYLTNDSILADTTLAKLGDFLANRCNVQMENYPDAISWYENKIENPEIETDSIFAIIDVGEIYLHMDTTGNRPVYIGSLPQYKPESQVKFGKYRDSLISLLPFPKKSDLSGKGLRQLQAGQLLQNAPNPANSSTDIYYKLWNAMSATLTIYDSWGRICQQIPLNELNDGVHKIMVNTSMLTTGVYEYSLCINNQRTDSKRMIVVR